MRGNVNFDNVDGDNKKLLCSYFLIGIETKTVIFDVVASNKPSWIPSYFGIVNGVEVKINQVNQHTSDWHASVEGKAIYGSHHNRSTEVFKFIMKGNWEVPS